MFGKAIGMYKYYSRLFCRFLHNGDVASARPRIQRTPFSFWSSLASEPCYGSSHHISNVTRFCDRSEEKSCAVCGVVYRRGQRAHARPPSSAHSGWCMAIVLLRNRIFCIPLYVFCSKTKQNGIAMNTSGSWDSYRRWWGLEIQLYTWRIQYTIFKFIFILPVYALIILLFYFCCLRITTEFKVKFF